MSRYLLIIFFFLLAVPSHAADNLLKDKLDAINQGGNQESWLSSSLETNLSLGIKSLVGEPEFNPDGSIKIGWIPGGLIGTTNNLIGQLYQPPASGLNYVANTWNSFLGRPAYAQGVGFRGLEPLMDIWRSFRNIVYTLSSVIFIFIGLMIMLRIKISPQAVITIQNAVPNLITTLILVTFSYAIAGLLIDLSYFVQAAGVLIIFPSFATFGGLSGVFYKFLQALNSLPIISAFVPNIPNIYDPNMGVVTGLLTLPALATLLLSFVITIIIGGVLTAPFGIGIPILSQVGNIAVTASLGTITALLVFLLLTILILIWLIKFSIGLFRCYATLIFKIVLAPLEIGLGAFPNMKMGFSTWITDVISNLAVFVLSYLFILLSNSIILKILWGDAKATVTNIFSDLLSGQAPQIGLWVPNMLQTGSLPVPGTWLAVGAIGLSTLLLLSKLPDMIPQFIFMIKPSPWGQAIGQTASGMSPTNLISGAAEKYKNWNVLTGGGQDGMIPGVVKGFGKVKERMQRSRVESRNPNITAGTPTGPNKLANNTDNVADEAYRDNI